MPRARVTIFGPDPLLSVTIEAGGGGDEIHVHPAGQGVWVARMAAELGAEPVLCSLLGGESGILLRTLLEALPGQLRATAMAAPSGSYVVDRRSGERRVVASALRPAPARHEVDDLVAGTCAAALNSTALVMGNPFPPEGLPEDVYDTIAADVRAGGLPLLVDLSPPRLNRVLPHEPELVKLNDWELAAYVYGPVDGPRALRAARSLCDAGARTVVLTRAEQPVLVVPRDAEPYEIVPPAFPRGFREGCGDTMMGAIAAAYASGSPLCDAVVLGAAAGAGNFLRHGLGTGKREAVEELARRVAVRPLSAAAQAA